MLTQQSLSPNSKNSRAGFGFFQTWLSPETNSEQIDGQADQNMKGHVSHQKSINYHNLEVLLRGWSNFVIKLN